jgi:RNA polymerase sigma-70 factor (ECF subfamily)
MTCSDVYVSAESVSEPGLADYDEFFTNMRPQLVGLGFALTGNLQVASDLAQEALLRSWVSWDKIRTYQDPNAWARRVLRNLAANHARRLRRAPRPHRSRTWLS